MVCTDYSIYFFKTTIGIDIIVSKNCHTKIDVFNVN